MLSVWQALEIFLDSSIWKILSKLFIPLKKKKTISDGKLVVNLSVLVLLPIEMIVLLSHRKESWNTIRKYKTTPMACAYRMSALQEGEQHGSIWCWFRRNIKEGLESLANYLKMCALHLELQVHLPVSPSHDNHIAFKSYLYSKAVKELDLTSLELPWTWIFLISRWSKTLAIFHTLEIFKRQTIFSVKAKCFILILTTASGLF